MRGPRGTSATLGLWVGVLVCRPKLGELILDPKLVDLVSSVLVLGN